MRNKWSMLLAAGFVGVFLVTRWPGLMPANFSAVYGFAFCAGVFLTCRTAFALPLGAMLVSDLVLNIWVYRIVPWHPMMLVNYVVIAGIIWLGRRFSRRDSLLKLVGGGFLAALIFYVITNTAAWFFNPFRNPEYTRTFAGWLTALTKGTGGYPETWVFFRNTLLSGGLFTALFAAASKLCEHAEDPAEESEEDPAPKPKEEAEASA